MPLGGGQDLLARMKDYVTQPDRIVNVKAALEATVTPMPGGGLKIGAAMKIVDLAEHAQVAQLYPAIALAAGSKSARRRFAIRAPSAAISISGRAAGTSATKSSSASRRAATSASLLQARTSSTPSSAAARASSSIRRALRCRLSPTARRSGCFGPKGERMVPAADYFTMPTLQNVRDGERARAGRAADARDPAGARQRQERPLRGSLQGVARLADRLRDRAADDERATGARRPASSWAPLHRFRGDRRRPKRRWPARPINEETAAAAAEAALRDARPLSQNAYKIQVAKTAVKRAILHAGGFTDQSELERASWNR